MKGQLALLLAEDDENDVFLLRRALSEANIDNPLFVARDGQEAIDYLAGAGKFADREQHPLPCLFILDLKMPRKTGMEVLQWLRQQPALHALPVLILSSSAQRHDIDRAYALGANAFVVKPGGVQERAALAKVIKEFWLNFNQPPSICNPTPQTHEAPVGRGSVEP